MKYNFTEHFIIAANNTSYFTRCTQQFVSASFGYCICVCVFVWLYLLFYMFINVCECEWVRFFNANIRIFLLSPFHNVRTHSASLSSSFSIQTEIAIKITLRYIPLTLDNEHRLVVFFLLFMLYSLPWIYHNFTFSLFKCSLLNKLSWCQLTLSVPKSISLPLFVTFYSRVLFTPTEYKCGPFLPFLLGERFSIGFGGFLMLKFKQ